MDGTRPRTMVNWTSGGSRFGLRTVAVCLHDGHVLLHRAERDDYWALPGGRVELGEPSDAALARELREELGVESRIDRLLWLAENFFEHGDEVFHEIGLYYEVMLPTGSPYLDITREWRRLEEDGLPLIFRWFPVADLEGERVYPQFLRLRLGQLPPATERVVEVELAN